MNILDINNIQTVFYTVMLGIFPMMSILFALIGFKYNDSNIILFGIILLMPSAIILFSITI